jgi:hypothetical protein
MSAFSFNRTAFTYRSGSSFLIEERSRKTEENKSITFETIAMDDKPKIHL